MEMREWFGAALASLLATGAVLFPTIAVGQVTLGQLVPPVEKAAAPPADGFYITPSLSIGELYDDNIFFTDTNRKQDFFTRVSPGIQAGYQSTPFTFMDIAFGSRKRTADKFRNLRNGLRPPWSSAPVRRARWSSSPTIPAIGRCIATCCITR